MLNSDTTALVLPKLRPYKDTIIAPRVPKSQPGPKPEMPIIPDRPDKLIFERFKYSSNFSIIAINYIIIGSEDN
mgnify:CR=1 FL=1